VSVRAKAPVVSVAAAMMREMVRDLVCAEWPHGLVKTVPQAPSRHRADGRRPVVKLIMQDGTPEERERAKRFREG
jgi:hypothetical protein